MGPPPVRLADQDTIDKPSHVPSNHVPAAPVRLFVWLIALLFASVALAGCHDLLDEDDAASVSPDDGADPSDTEADGPGDGEEESEQETETTSEEETEEETETATETETETATETETETEDNGDDPPPEVEIGDFDADHTLTVETGALCSNDEFTPSSFTISAGEAVEWEHNGSLSCTHNVQLEDPDEGTDTFSTGETSQAIRFNEPGTYDYYCQPHGAANMSGTIIVE